MFLICKEVDGKIEARGVFDNNSDAEAQAISGKWLVVPLIKNKLYNQNIASEDMTGAMLRLGHTDDINASINVLTNRLETLIAQLIEFRDNTNSRLDALEGV